MDHVECVFAYIFFKFDLDAWCFNKIALIDSCENIFIYIFYLSFNRELVKFDFMNCTARFAIEILLFK